MLDDLRHFLLVTEHGTVTAAAKVAHVTQPAMTLSLKRLEASLGAALFIRQPRGMELTAAGAVLVPRARATLAALSDARRAVAEVSGLMTGVVRLGAGATVCTYYLPRLLARFRKRHRSVQIHVREAPTGDLDRALEAGELDLCILSRRGGEVGIAHAHAERWQTDELVFVRAPTFGGRKPRIDASTPFISFPRGSTTREALESCFPQANVVMELGGIAAIKSNVRAGIGVALMSTRAIERDLEQKTLAIIAHPATPIRRTLVLAHRGLGVLPPAAAALRRLLLSVRLVGSARKP